MCCPDPTALRGDRREPDAGAAAAARTAATADLTFPVILTPDVMPGSPALTCLADATGSRGQPASFRGSPVALRISFDAPQVGRYRCRRAQSLEASAKVGRVHADGE